MLLGGLSFISPSNQSSPSSLTPQTTNASTIVWLHQTELASGASCGLGTGIRQSISIHLPGWHFVVTKNLLHAAAQPEAWLVHPSACVAESDRVQFHAVGQRLFRDHSKESQVWFLPRCALTESSRSRLQYEPECRPQTTFAHYDSQVIIIIMLALSSSTWSWHGGISICPGVEQTTLNEPMHKDSLRAMMLIKQLLLGNHDGMHTFIDLWGATNDGLFGSTTATVNSHTRHYNPYGCRSFAHEFFTNTQERPMQQHVEYLWVF